MSDPLAEIRSTTRTTLSALLPSGSPVALLDAPSYPNAGDGMIWLGQLAYLRELGHAVAYAASQESFSEGDLRRRLPTGPLLLTGGGNLGDRYLNHQEFREQVIRTFPDRPIIQLSQSIDFRDEQRAAAARAVFEAHPDLTLLIREQMSLTRARELFPNTRIQYCPDTAFGMGRLASTGSAEVDLLFLLRRDTEGVARQFDVPADLSHAVSDWLLPLPTRAAWKVLRRPEMLSRDATRLRGPAYHLMRACGHAMIASNVRSGRRTLARGRVVVTDRLHAMVLASLSGIPVVALDNSYGKVSAIHRDYAGGLPHTHFARSSEEAVDLARSLLSVARGEARNSPSADSAAWSGGRSLVTAQTRPQKGMSAPDAA